jgi:hypothetical protein
MPHPLWPTEHLSKFHLSVKLRKSAALVGDVPGKHHARIPRHDPTSGASGGAYPHVTPTCGASHQQRILAGSLYLLKVSPAVRWRLHPTPQSAILETIFGAFTYSWFLGTVSGHQP